ncbi:MAG: hypothetical protein BWK77_03305 [Verrucomicrobia bacterium A1]|nr:MAG: hypothetical protein BWK77_03305 [Verrucomicrobia bacterium A1]
MADTAHAAGQTIHGFDVLAVTPLPDLRATATRLIHRKSGARLLHLAAADPENLFAVAFRTPPEDDTGLPHILEHTVLCGSRRYPVKDPFVELLKTSLATFLNAMTYPDRTVYPCASMNAHDFTNLMRVYCDAVFHPRITEEHFRQEGHHLDVAEPGNPASPLAVKGIVFNEMKGVYSTLDGVIQRTAAGLFPDNAYGRDSGGSPEAIPSLTYAQFRAFHARYYHPSNAFFFLYGDTPLAPHLELLDREFLAAFDRLAIDTAIAPQSRWTAPRRVTAPYPAAEGETPARKSAFVMEWFANPLTDPETSLAMGVLGEVLLSHEGSPLRRALVESRLGEDLVAEGYSTYRRDTSFGVGLRGIDVARAGEVECLILDTLRGVADRGLEPGPLDSAFHQFELAALDIPSSFPLVLMDRVFAMWLYDADPLTMLHIRSHLASLRERSRAEPGFFENHLRRQILDNPHCLAMTFVPDPAFHRRREAEFAQRLATVRAGLAPAEIARIDREARALERSQEAPNSPEALATLPRLRRADVPVEPQRLPVETATVAGRPLLRAETLSNGVGYLRLAVDLRGLDADLWDYLPLFVDGLTKTGAAGEDYAVAAEREAAACAGIGASVSTGGRADDPTKVQPFLHLATHALDDRIDRMLDVLRNRILSADFTDVARLQTLLVQHQTGLREAVVPSGNAFAASRAQRGLSDNAALAERFGGVSQVRFAQRLAEGLPCDLAGLARAMERIRKVLLARGRLTASFVGSDNAHRRVAAWYAALLGELPDSPVAPATPAAAGRPSGPEGIAVPAEVAFVAQAFRAVAADHPLAPALLVLATRLSLDFLWTEIRVKNGAYGCRAAFSQSVGLFSLGSYRDPRIRETLNVYSRIPDYVATGMDFSTDAVEQSVIGALKALDRPIRPEGAVATALDRHLTGADEPFRRRFRERLLAVSGAELRRVAEEIVRPGLAAAPICVVAGRSMLESAAADLPGLRIEDL